MRGGGSMEMRPTHVVTQHRRLQLDAVPPNDADADERVEMTTAM